MSWFRMVQSVAAVGASAALLAARPAVRHESSPGCDTSSPRASKFLATANATFPHLDSTRVARLGWRKAPKSVTFVTQPAKCDAIVAAHNRFVNGNHAAYHLTTAIVAQAGDSYLVEVPPGPGAAEQMIFIYDSSLKFTAVF